MKETIIIGRCGDANPKGNISLFYKGACKISVSLEGAYRCTGCGGYFHKNCILKHFKLEKKHDWGRNDLLKLIKEVLNKEIAWCLKHPAKNLSKDFQEGFVAGIQQAINIIKRKELVSD